MVGNLKKPRVPVLGFIAPSGAGKTTLLSRVVRLLSGQGLRVGVVKQARDDFDVDIPGKDSYELRKAGVERLLLTSERKSALMLEHPGGPDPQLTELLPLFDQEHLDLILTEGFTTQPFPKIELYRKGCPLPRYTHDPWIIALVTDGSLASQRTLPELDINDPAAIADFIGIYLTGDRNFEQEIRVMSNDTITLQPSCADDYDPNSLPVAAALERIDLAVKPVAGYELLALRSALGRVLAETVTSPLDVPAHTNSAMDGYAVRAADLPQEGMRELRIIGTALAGAPFGGTVKLGTAVRIMTGAVMPEGADTVVMQERAERLEDFIQIGPGNKAGQNVRRAGEDLSRGSTVLEAGRLLLPADLGVLASLGIAELRVRRQLRVAFFSTGDELRSIGETLGEGDIYDSNRYTLYGMLRRLGVDLIDMGIVRDRREDLRQALREASQSADAVITSGGVSVGEADFVKDILTALGEVNFWKIAMKPGRPLAFGKIGGAVFFGLPGNPVSVMVTFYEFVAPALRRMMGQTEVQTVTVRVPCATRLKKRPGRKEFQRGILSRQDDGSMIVYATGDQGSGILSSMTRANCFIVLPDDCGNVAEGTLVDVKPFDGLV